MVAGLRGLEVRERRCGRTARVRAQVQPAARLGLRRPRERVRRRRDEDLGRPLDAL